MRNSRFNYILILPTILLIILLIIIPFVYLVIFAMPHLGEYLIKDYILKSFIYTLTICTLTTLITHLIGVPLGIYLANNKNKFTSSLIYIMLFSTLVSGVVRMIAWIDLLAKDGAINSILLNVNIISEPLSLIHNIFSITLGFIYILLPVVTISIYSSVIKVDKEIVLAAKTLGANNRRTLFKVVLPQIYHEILSTILIVFTTTLTLYSIPKILGGNRMVLSVLLESSVKAVNYQQEAVIALLMISINIVIIVSINLLQRKRKWL